MRIVFFDLDTLRPDHLGCYGYSCNTSPNIDAIAREGTRFDNYYCSDAPCLPSRSALWSGRFGIHTGVTGHVSYISCSVYQYLIQIVVVDSYKLSTTNALYGRICFKD